MLLQSEDGVIRIFPAVPSDWKYAAFDSLRATGAFLVSARMEEGRLIEVEILAEKGGSAVLQNGFPEGRYRLVAENKAAVRDKDEFHIETKRGDRLRLKVKEP
ncbi:MAG: hypothetical protein V3V05_03385 [Pontiella sp.]